MASPKSILVLFALGVSLLASVHADRDEREETEREALTLEHSSLADVMTKTPCSGVTKVKHCSHYVYATNQAGLCQDFYTCSENTKKGIRCKGNGQKVANTKDNTRLGGDSSDAYYQCTAGQGGSEWFCDDGTYTC